MRELSTGCSTQAQHGVLRALRGEVVGRGDDCPTRPRGKEGADAAGRGCSILGGRFSATSCHQPTSSDCAGTRDMGFRKDPGRGQDDSNQVERVHLAAGSLQQPWVINDQL